MKRHESGSWHGSRPPEENHVVVAAYRQRDEARAERNEAVRLLREFGACDPYSGQPYDEVVEFLARVGKA